MTDYIVLDTDVASLSFRRRLPASAMAFLAAKSWCLSFATVAEMTQWAHVRSWSRRNRGGLDAWVADRVFVEADRQVARTWGHLSADGRLRGRTHPVNDTWIAACCLAEGLPLATLNTKDFTDFAQHNALTLVTLQ